MRLAWWARDVEPRAIVHVSRSPRGVHRQVCSQDRPILDKRKPGTVKHDCLVYEISEMTLNKAVPPAKLAGALPRNASSSKPGRASPTKGGLSQNTPPQTPSIVKFLLETQKKDNPASPTLQPQLCALPHVLARAPSSRTPVHFAPWQASNRAP